VPFLFALPTLGLTDEKDSFSSSRFSLEFSFLFLHFRCCWLMATANIGVRGGLRFFGDSEGFFFVFKQSLLVYPRFGLSEEFYFSLLALPLPLEVPFFCSFRTGKKMICCLISSSKMPSFFFFPLLEKISGEKSRFPVFF